MSSPSPLSPSSSSSSSSFLIGGLELGGTTIKVAIAEGNPTNVIDQRSFPTHDPASTLEKAQQYFRRFPIRCLGIGSFGPVDLQADSPTYGYITSTPKPKWDNAPVVSAFSSFSVPIGFQTDVNAAALGEVQWGEHGNISSCAYVTVGTGIGAGIATGNEAVTGLMHPELGHYLPPRYQSDTFKGLCPYHGACVEGLANAAAIAARKGIPPSELQSVPDSDPVWDIEAFYLAHLCSVLLLSVSPQVIVLGGGVLKRQILFPLIRKHFLELCNGYVRVPAVLSGGVDKYIISSRFDAENSKTSAGCVGALEVGRRAWIAAAQQQQHKQKEKDNTKKSKSAL